MSTVVAPVRKISPEIATLQTRERYRDRYWLTRDPILDNRLLWRAHTFRHMVHLLPGQTVLELGAGKGLFTRQLGKVTRGRNPITSVQFDSAPGTALDLPADIERIAVDSLPGPLVARRFDFIVAMDLLDRRNCAWLLRRVYEML